MSFNIMQTTVSKNNCIGCGICDTICPVNVLKMDFNSSGMYEPIESEGCLDKCTLCVDACPFVNENPNEKELAKKIYGDEDNSEFHKDLGHFVNTYEVYKKDTSERLKSASGGAGHSILKNLLEQKLVDAVNIDESQFLEMIPPQKEDFFYYWLVTGLGVECNAVFRKNIFIKSCQH